MNKFLLIDDHNVVRSGIKGLLLEIYKPAEIHEASNGDEAIEKVKVNNYSLVLMDIQMPNTDPLGVLEFILVKDPHAKVLIFSMSSENIYAKRFLRAGAKGFISKEASLDEVMKAFDLILNGRIYVSETLSQSLANESFSGAPVNPFNKLSEREFEIASLLLAGHSTADITRLLSLQTSTVGTHKSRMFEKLGVGSILELNELARSYAMFNQ